MKYQNYLAYLESIDQAFDRGELSEHEHIRLTEKANSEYVVGQFYANQKRKPVYHVSDEEFEGADNWQLERILNGGLE